MRTEFKSDKIKYYIGDVRNYDSISDALSGVDYVFHAAALKQVPSCEFYPMEAVKTNVDGSENLFRASIANNVKKVILLSTDKAVYPVNAMGISKAMAEKLMIAKARSARDGETVFCATRYGNVMASRGSVIPLFVDFMKNNKDLTITDTNMTRFLMSLEDSVDLVLHAFAHGEQGDIFVQKAPSSTVMVLATALKELFDSSVDMKLIGARHGEKSYETLVSKEEMVKAEDNGRYYRITSDKRGLNYADYEADDKNEEIIDEYNSDNTEQLNVEQVKELLLKLPYIRYQLGKLNKIESKLKEVAIE